MIRTGKCEGLIHCEMSGYKINDMGDICYRKIMF